MFDTGDLYGLPSYAHPELLKDLPEESENGLDRKTLSGAFSRAHSDYWCEHMADTLRDLRGQHEPYKIAACEYLAGFAFGGTEQGYNGSLRERLMFNGKEIKSLCAVRGVLDGPALDMPSRLPPGYVDALRGADALSSTGMGQQSVANWCAKVPVLRLSSDPVLADQNLVAELAPGLNRWAVAEDRLTRLTFPRLMGLIEGRLTKLESLVGQPCGPTTEFAYQLHNAPISIAAATPHFTAFDPAIGTRNAHSTDLDYAAYDRFPLRWDTPNRLIETMGWQVDPDILDHAENLPPAKRDCPHYIALYSAVADMANFETVYGDQVDDLMGTGVLYDRLAPRTISFLPDAESETSCLRCEKIDIAVQAYASHLQRLDSATDTSPIGFGVAEAMQVFRPTGQTYLEARKSELEQELARCRNI